MPTPQFAAVVISEETGPVIELPSTRWWVRGRGFWGQADAPGTSEGAGMIAVNASNAERLLHSVSGGICYGQALGTSLPAEKFGLFSSQPWAHSPVLTSLTHVGRSGFSSLDWMEKSGIPSLAVADLFCIAPEKIPPGFLSRFQKLQSLVLPYSGGGNVDLTDITPELVELFIYNRAFDLQELNGLSRFQKLRVLSLVGCSVRAGGQPAWRRHVNEGWVKEVEELHLNATDQSLPLAIAGCKFPRLKRLVIDAPMPFWLVIHGGCQWEEMFPQLERLDCTIELTSPLSADEMSAIKVRDRKNVESFVKHYLPPTSKVVIRIVFDG